MCIFFLCITCKRHRKSSPLCSISSPFLHQWNTCLRYTVFICSDTNCNWMVRTCMYNIWSVLICTRKGACIVWTVARCPYSCARKGDERRMCVTFTPYIYYVNEEPGSDSRPHHECLVWLCGLVTCTVYTRILYNIYTLECILMTYCHWKPTVAVTYILYT